MKQDWKMVKLGEVLKRQFDSVEIDDSKTYKRLTIKTKGQGITLRDEVIGSEIGTKNQFRVKANQFLLSKIDAMNGAFGIVPKECNGGIITGNFWTFDFNENVLNREFLDFLCIGGVFTDFSLKASEGTTNRKYLREDKFNNLDFPLPPLSEQQRIAGRLAALKEKINTVRALRGEQEKIKSAFRNGLFNEVCRDFNMVALQSVLIPRKEVVAVAPQTEYKQITVKMQHKGVILRGTVLGAEVGSVQLRAKEGDFIISKIDARNGAMGIVPKSLDNAIVTNDFPLFSFSNDCLPKYFEFVSNTDYFDQKCIQSSEGTTNRVRLKMDRFAKIEIPLPPLSEQKRMIDILEKIDTLQEIKAEQLSALDGLFPGVLEQAFRGEW